MKIGKTKISAQAEEWQNGTVGGVSMTAFAYDNGIAGLVSAFRTPEDRDYTLARSHVAWWTIFSSLNYSIVKLLVHNLPHRHPAMTFVYRSGW